MTDTSPAEVAGGEVSLPEHRANGSARGRVNGLRRKPTATSRFGVSRRESHDSTEFYERFPAPEISEDDHVNPPATVDRIWTGDARAMDEFGEVADSSVALVVTSPPYYAGKQYETAVGEGHVPESYIAYVEMLRDVFAECWRKLQPGGRIAVNVANLGRKPYRSLSADVTAVLQDLRFLLRGEVIWVKGKAAGGSCAWGTFQRPGNPVLRDVSERIIVASKGRFDRAKGARDRAAAALPSVATISADEFMELTTDVWEFPPESATRVGHPAPFPVELPRRLIDLYTYEGDLVLDPFMGSGSTAIAAVRTGRHYVGFDTDAHYVATSLARIEEERAELDQRAGGGLLPARPVRLPAVPAGPHAAPAAIGSGAVVSTDRASTNGSRETAVADGPAGHGGGPRGGDASLPAQVAPIADPHSGLAGGGHSRRSGSRGAAGDRTALGGAEGFEAVEQAVREGRKVKDVARQLLDAAGFRRIESDVKVTPGVEVSFRARDARGQVWCFDVTGGFSNGNPGLRKAETLWRALGKASVVAASGVAGAERFVLLTVEVPLPNTPPARALAAVCGTGPGKTVADVIRLRDPADQRRLRSHATGGEPASASEGRVGDGDAGAAGGRQRRGRGRSPGSRSPRS